MSERIGPYEIVSQIGEGGMGQVYRAVDTRLDRTVAIKRLKSGFNERFEREARAISALNHPHIATLHDVGSDYLVMEYVDGKPLAGPLPLDKALEYGKQILSALDAAHKLGIVHRDLKPANILVTKAGVKLLDFGLAKMRPKASAASAEHTMTLALTGEHTIMGTPQYMAPEQIEGREADARSDMFAFGCVLYEMLTGTRAFDGKSASSVMAAVLAAEPRPLRELAPVVPDRLDKVLRACLAKDPDERWQNASDLRRELEWLTVPERAEPRRGLRWMPWALAALAVAAWMVTMAWMSRIAPAESERVAFTLGGEWRTLFGGSGGMAVSPNGKKLAVIATSKEGERGLWVRELGNTEPKRLIAHPSLQGVFWSPDSGSVGFTVANELRTIEISTGETRTLASNITNFRGATWNSSGDIVYMPRIGGEMLVVKLGERPRSALVGVTGGAWPSFLPNGKDFLYVHGTTASAAGLSVGTFGTDRTKRLMDASSSAVYSNGHLLWAGAGLMARPFDTERLEFTGPAIQLNGAAGVLGRNSLFSASDGTLAYYSRFTSETKIAWTDISGATRPISRAGTAHAEISPDGKRILFSRDYDLWVWDLTTGAESRLTFGSGNDWIPAWTPDGKSAVWVSGAAGERSWRILRKRADGVGSEETLFTSDSYIHHLHMSPDAKTIAAECGASGATDLCLLGMDDRKFRTVLKTPANEIHPQFSPDGKWVAIASDSSGRYEVYVYAFPSMSGPWQVSTEGGIQPRWREDGKVLYYLNHKADITAVDVSSADGAFRSGATHTKVFSTELEPMIQTSHYSVAPDGKHVLITERPNAEELNVVRNWSGLLNRQ